MTLKQIGEDDLSLVTETSHTAQRFAALSG
jgi:hypothetical protein